jgi:hypothetical protein
MKYALDVVAAGEEALCLEEVAKCAFFPSSQDSLWESEVPAI